MEATVLGWPWDLTTGNSVARVPASGGPAADKTFASHAVGAATLRRWWLNTLAVVGAQAASWQLLFWLPQERGSFIRLLREVRTRASATQLDALSLRDADMVPIYTNTDVVYNNACCEKILSNIPEESPAAPRKCKSNSKPIGHHIAR